MPLQKVPSLVLLGALLALTACTGNGDPVTEPEPAPESEPEAVLEPEVEPETERPLPAVTGLVALDDENPDVGVVEYTLNINDTTMSLYPGTDPTGVYAYNDMIPGPLLRARVGETVRIIATNNLSEPTTIHWHGLRIDWRMDGVAHGSLPAIAPGETFTYEFVPPDAGTYWYHPHVRTEVQTERGLYGMMIVDEEDDIRPDVDADRGFVLDDIRLNEDGSIAPHAMSGPDIVHGRSGNVLLVNGGIDPVEVKLAEGGVERWRLVNTANAREMLFRFPGLEVREIGADGGLWPQQDTRIIDELTLPIGARAELEVRWAAGATAGSMESMVLSQNQAGQLVLSPFVMANVSVGTATEDDAAGFTAEIAPEPITARLDVDVVMEMEALNVGGQIVMQIAGAPFEQAPVWHVTQGELQVMKVINRMPQNGHPFHLHGQFFQILARDGADTVEPGWRDTVMIPAGAGRSVTVATYFDNPGTWMYHCHILEHADAGMMALVEVSPAE